MSFLVFLLLCSGYGANWWDDEPYPMDRGRTSLCFDNLDDQAWTHDLAVYEVKENRSLVGSAFN
jgi:hypothetical protein